MCSICSIGIFRVFVLSCFSDDIFSDFVAMSLVLLACALGGRKQYMKDCTKPHLRVYQNVAIMASYY
jgi:hypothetical protein